MLNYLLNINPIYQALLAGIFTWFLTALGAATIVLFKRDNKTIMDIMLTIAAGVMVAASFFSLLLPAIEMAENLDKAIKETNEEVKVKDKSSKSKSKSNK